MPRPSGSVMTSAKLVVPAGTLVQDSGGGTLSPTQVGLDLLEPAFFFASIWPSLNEDEVMVKTACAFALWPLSVSATPAAITNVPKLRNANMTFPLDTGLVVLRSYLGWSFLVVRGVYRRGRDRCNASYSQPPV